jgi:cytochrome c553
MKKLLRSAVPVTLAFALGIVVQRSLTPAPASSGKHASIASQGTLLAQASDGKASPSEVKFAKSLASGSAAEIIAQLKGTNDYEESGFAMRTMLMGASQERLAAMAAEVATMPQGKREVTMFTYALVKQWSKVDGDGALAWAKTLPGKSGRNLVISVISTMATHDTSAALALADGLPDAKSRREARSAIANNISKKDPLQALALMEHDKSSNARYNIGQIYANWYDQDPVAAQQAVAKLTGGKRDTALQYIYRKMADTDPLAAVTAASALAPGMRKIALSSALQTWSSSDSAAAWAFCQSLPPGDPTRSDAQGAILSNIISADPTKALAVLGQLTERDKSSGVLANVMNNWAQADPLAALTYVAGLTSQKDRKKAMQNIGYTLDFYDPASTEKILNQFPNNADRKILIQGYLNNHSYNDPGGCLALLSYLSPADQEKTINDTGLMGYLARQDPDLAIKTLKDFPSIKNDGQWGNIISTLADTDPVKALQTLQSLPTDLQNKAMPSYLSTLARQDVNQAMSMAQALPEGDVRSNSLSNVISQWCSQDADAVLAWARTVQGKDRSQALSAVLSQKTQEDPDAGVKLFSTLVSSGLEEDRKVAENSVSSVAYGLYRQDPNSVAQWITQLGDEKLQTSAINQISSQWVSDDPVEASAWIKQLPIGDAKDHAVQYLISNIKSSDPESALAWALASGKENTRVNLATEVLRTWIKNDPVAGKQALLRSPLNEEQRNRLLRTD